jgi:hypothetical protein
VHYRQIRVVARSLEAFFSEILTSEETLATTLRKRLYDAARPRLGAPRPDELYGFVPALILGGVESAEALERMQAAAHLSLLFQLGRASSFDANADADASAEINLPELPATAEQALAPARLEAWREPQGAVLERAREINRAAKSIHDSHADYCSALARY